MTYMMRDISLYKLARLVENGIQILMEKEDTIAKQERS